jgi:HD-GYP domain-containing protein (c-di-GMP phosphodiesterase class II)
MSTENNGFSLRKIIEKKHLKLLLFSDSMQKILPLEFLSIENEGQSVFNHAAETKSAKEIKPGIFSLNFRDTQLIIRHYPELDQPRKDFLAHLIESALQQSLKTFLLGQETLESYKEINTVFQVSKSLARSRYIEQLLQEILAEFQKILPSAYSSLWLRKKKSRKLHRQHFILNQKHSPYSHRQEKKLIEYLVDVYNMADIFSPPLPDFFPAPQSKNPYCMFVPLKTMENSIGGILIAGAPKMFRSVDLKLAGSIALQASFFIQNSLLLEDIEGLFDSMVRSMVTAIDARDPATCGHSERIASISTAFARVISEINEGSYAEAKFTEEELREIKYAGLLHDIGKIGVREEILKKQYKLSAGLFSTILTRFEYIELKYNISLTDEKKCVTNCNQSYRLDDENLNFLAEISKKTYENNQGQTNYWLTEAEYEQLKVRFGNLTPAEIAEMKKHPEGTLNILSKISFSKDLRRVPLIAAQHHEKIDGTGYPYGLKGKQVLLQSQIMGIADIYEALTAYDRPYKPPLSREEALSILNREVDAGRIDRELFRIFKENIDEIAGTAH